MPDRLPQLHHDARRWRVGMVAVGLATAGLLVLTADAQIYDTNFYTLWEATTLLAGDHPYRDFYEWGVPLQMLVSAAAQRVAGYRLLNEFLVQWTFIVAGAVVAFRLGLVLSRSVGASLAAALVALLALAGTPTFHYPKLFFYPVAVALCWRYIERPGPLRGAAVGLITGLAFLFRHDHGIYIGVAAVLAFVLARCAVPASRWPKSMLADAAAYTLTAALIVAPWAFVVERSEGLAAYVDARADLYDDWSAGESPYRALRTINPVRMLRGDPPPAPVPGEISFEWGSDVDDRRRQELESRFRLRLVRGPGEDGRWHYALDNVLDPNIFELSRSFNRADGLDWDRLDRLAEPRPTRDAGVRWLQQMTMLVPLLLVAAAAIDLLTHWRRRMPLSLDTYRILLAAGLLLVVGERMFREASYALLVAPLTAALAARWLVWDRAAWKPWAIARWTIAVAAMLLSAIAAHAWARTSPIFWPSSYAPRVRSAFAQLTASPPIDGYAPAAVVHSHDRAAWLDGDVDRLPVILRYLRDCTAPGDRILVTGTTPFQVAYYTERPIAGGHVFWHFGWRADAVREADSLAMLQRQPVPFAVSTSDPVLTDLALYPAIHRHVLTHYRELEGSEGLVLVDSRRQPTGEFGRLGFPCFG